MNGSTHGTAQLQSVSPFLFSKQVVDAEDAMEVTAHTVWSSRTHRQQRTESQEPSPLQACCESNLPIEFDLER